MEVQWGSSRHLRMWATFDARPVYKGWTGSGGGAGLLESGGRGGVLYEAGGCGGGGGGGIAILRLARWTCPGTWLPLAYMHWTYELSYRRWTSYPAPGAAVAPKRAPPNSPAPAPIAAPAPAAPDAAPIRAPAPAPKAPPAIVPPTTFSLTVRLAFQPVLSSAHWRHEASSVWNTSKGLFCPGMTSTLGPGGIVAQPTNKIAARHSTLRTRLRIRSPLISLLRRFRRGNHLHPAARAGFYVRVVRL